MNRSVFLLSSLLACSAALPALAASRVSVFSTLPDPVWKAPTGGSSPLVRDAAGNFYGIGSSFGTYGGPIFYKLSPSGEFSVVHAFEQGDITPLTADGEGGYVAILTPPSLRPYIFRIGTDGTYGVKAVLEPQDIYGPGQLALTRASDGSFYGVHRSGPGGAPDTIFRMTAAGAISTVATFDELHRGASNALAEGPDGALYGVAGGSGPDGQKHTSIFRMSQDGTITIVYDIKGEGYAGEAPLAVAADGSLYGAFQRTSADSLEGYFHVGIDGSGWAIQKSPGQLGRPVTGADGKVYSITTTIDGSGNPVSAALVRVNADASTSVIGVTSDTVGASSYPPLSPEPDGGFAGVSSSGGSFSRGGVFQWSPAGECRTLAEFEANPTWSDLSALTFAADGSSYGCRSYGFGGGHGEVFRLSPQGDYSRVGTLPDTAPVAVTLAPDGNLYGISVPSLAGDRSTLFRMTPAGEVTTLKVFTDSKPATLFLAANGGLYGTAIVPGSPEATQVFHATTSGSFEILRTFNPQREGGDVQSLVYRNDGYLWGSYYGSSGSALFRMNSSAAADGGFVSWITLGYGAVRLATDSSGDLFGYFGPSSTKTSYLFQFRPEVKVTKTTSPITNIHDFGYKDVSVPGELILGQEGRLYGASTSGGDFLAGMIYSLAKSGADLRTHYQFGREAPLRGHMVAGPGGDIFLATSREDQGSDTVYPGHSSYLRVHVDNGPSAFDLWLQAQGLSGGADGDDDHDGLSNRMEFVLGTDPHQATAATAGFVQGAAIPGRSEVEAGATQYNEIASLAYSVSREGREAGFRVIPEYSYDLQQWHPAYVDWNPSLLGQDEHVSILQYQHWPSGVGQIYFRLRVETP